MSEVPVQHVPISAKNRPEVITQSLLTAEPGPIHHARSVKLANRGLRFYGDANI